MAAFILKKLFSMFLVLFGASILTYAMVLLAPGDAAREIAVARYGGESRLDQKTIDWIRKKEGLDQPFLQQYLRWLKHVAALNLGYSLVEEKDAATLIFERFLKTLNLALAAVLIAVVISFPLGVAAGMRRGTWVDSACVSFSVLGLSIPNFWLGLLLILAFSVNLHWLPSFGTGGGKHMILPAVTLGASITAYITRLLRSSVIDALKSEHILALRAVGAEKRLIIGKHVVKNTLIPVITIIGLEFGMILEGAVMTETVFAWPGLGSLMVDAVSNRDYPLIQGIVLFSGTVFVVVNFCVDLVCSFLDPRIRLK